MLRHVVPAGLLLTLACCPATQSVAADSSLAELAGRDAALFVEVTQLDRQWRQWEDSAFAQRMRRSPIAALVRAAPLDPIQKWTLVDAHVAKVTGTPLGDQLRALFGERVALALYLPDRGEPQGVLIARAVSPAAIDRALQSWEQVEPPLRIEERRTQNGKYFRRVIQRDSGERGLFYARQDTLFVLSDQEHLVRDCLDRAAGSTASLATAPEYGALAERARRTALVRAYLNPRQWDRVLERDAARSPQQQRLFEVWQAFRAVGASIETTSGLEAELFVVLDEGRTPSSWRTFAAPVPAPSILSDATDRTVAAFGARVRWPWLIAAWEQLLPAKDRDGLEKVKRVLNGLLLNHDPLAEAAPKVLEDWGVVLEANQQAEAQAWWQHWDVVAVSYLDDIKPALQDGIDNALLFALNAIAADRNSRGDENWHVRKTDRTRVLAGPPPIAPGYAWHSARLVLASREALLGVRDDAGGASPLVKLAASRFPHARVFAAFDLQAWRTRSAAADPSDPSTRLLGPLSAVADRAYMAAGWTERELRLKAGLIAEPE